MSRWVTARCTPSGLGPRWARISTSVARALRTTHRETYRIAARRTTLGDEELTREIPDAIGTEHLDPASGVARVGTKVKPGTILVGRVTPRGTVRSAADPLLGGTFGRTADGVRDTSLRAPPWTRGVVVAAGREEPCQPGELARAFVTVEWTRALTLGDVLEVEAHDDVVVCTIEDALDGLQVDGADGSVRVRKRAIAKDILQMRSIGPYSLVNQQPLVGKAQFGGQRIAEPHVRALVGAGCVRTASECMTIKSDAIAGRFAAYVSIVRGEDPTSMSGPVESAEVLRAEGLALGFRIDWDEGGATARWLGARALLERSHGEVTTPATFDHETLLPEDGGLFCARTFGPVRDHECLCGKYRGKELTSTPCDRCGVEVLPCSVRRQRFGHLSLAMPVIHPWMVEPLSTLLGLREDEIRERGALGVSDALHALDVATLARERSPRGTVAKALDAAGLAAPDLLVTIVPVLPADLRPVLPLEDGRFASSDVNELYAELIVQNDFARWAVEAARPRAILEEEARRLGEAYARLLLSGFGPHTSTAPEGRPLRGLAASLVAQGPQLVDKQVDFSGFGQLVLDDALAPRSCRLPRAMALELWKPHVFGALEELGHVTNIKVAKRVVDATIEALHDEPPCEPGPAEREGDFGVPPERVLDVLEQVVVGRPVLLAGKERVIARRVMLWDEVAIAVDPFTALLLDDDAVAVHVPLTDEAQRECDAMPDLTSSAEREPSGWLSGILFGSAAPCGLARAAIERHIDPLTDPVVRLALGLPPRDG